MTALSHLFVHVTSLEATRHAWLRDPDGYRLSLYTPIEGGAA